MIRAILCATLALISMYSGQVHSKSDPGLSSQLGLNSGGHSIGFKIVEGQDYSRAVTGGTTPSKVHARPIRVYLWYPAKDSQDTQAMHFGRYAELADQDIWPHEISGDLSKELNYSHKVLARSLGPERFEKLLRQPVRGIEGAEALAGPFPPESLNCPQLTFVRDCIFRQRRAI